MILFAAALYFGWLWNNRGASECRQLLASIRSRERVKRRVIKELDRKSKISPRFNPNRAAEQELRAAH